MSRTMTWREEDTDTGKEELTVVSGSSARHGPPSGPERTLSPDGQIYVVFASKGGIGSTTLSVNLATSFCRVTPRGAVVVDLDLQLGDVLTALNLELDSSLVDIIHDLADLDSAALKRRLAAHPTGVYALSQAHRLEQLGSVRPDGVTDLLRGLARHFDAVVVDGLRDFSDLSLAALDGATCIVLLVNEDVPSVRGAQRCLDLFRQLGYADQRLRVVVNRHRKHAAIRPEVIAEALATPIFALLGNDFAVVERAINSGVPLSTLAPAARVTRDIDRLTARLIGERLIAGSPGSATAHDGLLARLWTRVTGGAR